MTVTKRPNSRLVVAAWINSIPELRPGICATKLPSDNTTWGTSGFVVETVVGGGRDIFVPETHVVMQLDVHAVNPNSQRPPTWAAEKVMGAIMAATEAKGTLQRALTLPNGFGTARVMSAYNVREPAELYGDDASVAILSADFRFHWEGAPL